MSRKIKIAISIIITLILISLASTVFAETAVHQATGTNYKPSTLYPYVQSGRTYYCAERGGALRFWNESGAGELTYQVKPTSSSIATKYSTREQALEEYSGTGSNEGLALHYIREDIKNYVTSLSDYSHMVAYRTTGGEWDKGFGANTADDQVEIEGNQDIINRFKNGETITILGKRIAATPTYNREQIVENSNNRLSYILSSGKSEPAATNASNQKTNYQSTVSSASAGNINAIQYALWQDTRQNNPSASYVHNVGATPQPGDSRYDTAGLYTEAVEYENYYNNIKTNGYNPSFVNSSTNVTVNRSAGTYTVGPFTINYPDNAKFSYVEDMWITGGGTSTRSFTISGGNVSANKPYPSSGVPFYITFSASSLNYPTSIQVSAKFTYLKETYSKYVRMTGSGNIYEYYSTTTLGTMDAVQEEWNIARLQTESLEEYKGEVVKSGHTESKIVNELGNVEVDGKTYRKREEFELKSPNTYTYKKYIRYYEVQRYYGRAEYTIGIRDTGTDYSAQDNTYIEDSWSSRVWDSVVISTPFSTNLTMKIGGRVWVDQAVGKEGNVNGSFGKEDIKMPNVEVTLYEITKDGVKRLALDANGNSANNPVKYTDAEGLYTFSNLNALSQYYVRFKYNGQYYEPTNYTAPSNTVGVWQNTSNGTDYQNNYNNAYNLNQNFQGRLSFNDKFSSINSSTANYNGANGYNETFTKKELLGYTLQNDGSYKKTREAVIDDFGRLILQNSTDATTRKMIQFVKDCETYSWTKNANDKINAYPVNNTFTINSSNNEVINDKSQNINQGYKVRQEVDLAIKNDVDNVTLEINGKSQEYRYDTREIAGNAEATWEIGVRLSDAYYNTNYSREIYPADYEFRVSSYGENTQELGKTVEDELKAYITYKITVRNQSMSIRARIDEVVDFFDEDLEYVADRSYIQIKRGNNQGQYAVRAESTSRYSSLPGTNTSITGYQKLYIRGLDDIYLDAGQTADIYLTFMVKKDNNGYIKLDEQLDGTAIGVGKENIVEINGYSTLYKAGTVIPNVGAAGANKKAGLVDVDSNPGNLKATYSPKDGTNQFNKFEDDTDKAPNVKLILYKGQNDARIISGVVWEDNRNLVNNSQATATGNGIRDNGETLINGVTVQLVEIINDNGVQKEYVWREFGSNINGTASIGNGTGSGTKTEETPIINVNNKVTNYKFDTNKDGAYAFKSFVPGNYVVRFIYGDTVRTVLPTSSEVTSLLGTAGLNAKSYNGQDYKSTIYQVGLETYDGKNLSKQYSYDIAKGDTALVSDVKDLYDRRQVVNNYSTKEIRNSFAEELASYMSVPEYNGVKYDKDVVTALLNSFISNTKMTAETGIIDVQGEYNRTQTTNQTLNNQNAYHLANLDLGLEERPKAQIEIVKDIANLKITLADGTVLFDSVQGTDNLGWIKNPEYYSYENNLMTPAKYSSVENIRNSRTFGLVQPTIDKEIMHGATLKVTYEIKVINTGEVDYNEEQFYYTGIAQNKNNPVTTNAIQLVDYVPNNLQYYEAENNTYWNIVKASDLVAGDNNLVNKKLEDNLNKFNTIITTNKINTALVPAIYTEKVNSDKNSRVSVPLVLTQVLSAENKDDDLDYINKVELVAESNSVGRKMAYSVVGNQNPNKGEKPQELDSNWSEVKILPPFGTTLMYIIISVITIAAAALVVAGIVFIKKKVLTK